MDTTIAINRGKTFLDGIVYLIYQVFVFLIPIFFIPSISVPFSTGRNTFIILGALAVLFVWIIARLKDGTFSFPKTWAYFAVLLPLATYALATLFSGNTMMSLSGQNYETSTLGFFLIPLLVFALAPLVITGEAELKRMFKVMLASFSVVALYTVLKVIVGPDFLAFGVLSGSTANLLGKWNDLAVLFGAVILLSSVMLDHGERGRALRVLGWVSIAFSFFVLAVVNFKAVWVALFFGLLIVFVYSVSTSWMRRMGNTGEKMMLPLTTLITLVISLIFMFAGTTIGGIIADVFSVTNIEVRPSWQLTLDMNKDTLSDSPFFGVGPNRFTNVWLANKPADINNTVFWSVDFNNGIGSIPTMLSTAGIIGTLGLLVFLGLYLYRMGRSLFAIPVGSPMHHLFASSFAASIFLWVFSIIYVPSASLLVITLLLSGLTLAAGAISGTFSVSRISAASSQLTSFVVVLLSVLLLIGTAFFAYKVSTKALANVFFQQGAIAANRDNDLDRAERLTGRAASLSVLDIYYRFLSDIYLVRLGGIVNNTTLLESELQTQFQGFLGSSIDAAQRAVAYDDTNYQNFLQLGRVYEAIVPLGIQGSYESAAEAYGKALAMNPMSPEISLVLARLEIAKGDRVKARTRVEEALAKKSNYVDAIFFLSQLEAAEGRLPEATRAVESLAILSPNDPGVFFQLGFLLYSQKGYERAVQAFERAIVLSPDYANAKYFLGLSYYQTGAKDKAIGQFEGIAVSNPDNEEVKTILVNLKDGKPPFSGVAGVSPERRENPPVEETTVPEETL